MSESMDSESEFSITPSSVNSLLKALHAERKQRNKSHVQDVSVASFHFLISELPLENVGSYTWFGVL